MSIGVRASMCAIRLLAKYYRVKVSFNNHRTENSGAYCLHTHRISICMQKQGMISDFFHELGHHHCYQNNIWVNYHTYIKSLEHLAIHKRIAIKAERWVDRWAIKEMNKWFPKVKYKGSYSCPEAAMWLRGFLVPYYNEVVDEIAAKTAVPLDRQPKERQRYSRLKEGA